MAGELYTILDASLRGLGGEPEATAVGLVTAPRLATSGWRALVTGYLRSRLPHAFFIICITITRPIITQT